MDILKYYTSYALLVILLILTQACAGAPESSRPAQVAAAQAVLDLDIFGGFPTLSSDTPASVSALLRFVDVDAGGSIHVHMDTASGLPMASVRVESKDSRLPLGLEADGLLVAVETGQRDGPAEQVELEWTPWHGNGRYVLNLQLLDWQNGTIPSSQVITVNVTGIPENVPTMKSRFIELYQDHFALNLTSPVFARYNSPDPASHESSRWISTAYIGNRLYEINIFDDGQATAVSYAVNSDEGGGFCRPFGKIRMLAVIVDYGNTGLDPADAEAALRAGLDDVRQDWITYSEQIGLSFPILEVDLTTFVYGAPPHPGSYLTPDQIHSSSGLDPAEFDLLVEIDLDKENTTTGQYGGLGVSLGDGCRPFGIRRTNIAFNVRDGNALQNGMPHSIFEHELMHGMGWMHWWPNQSADGMSWVRIGQGWDPYLLFGWTDADRDGVIEILDPTPYGMLD